MQSCLLTESQEEDRKSTETHKGLSQKSYHFCCRLTLRKIRDVNFDTK